MQKDLYTHKPKWGSSWLLAFYRTFFCFCFFHFKWIISLGNTHRASFSIIFWDSSSLSELGLGRNQSLCLVIFLHGKEKLTQLENKADVRFQCCLFAFVNRWFLDHLRTEKSFSMLLERRISRMDWNIPALSLLPTKQTSTSLACVL